MSYSIGYTIRDGDDHEAGKAIANSFAFVTLEDAGIAQAEHLSAARAAALELAKVCASGDPDADVSVTISGHANTGHGRAEGWADESITVAVRAVRR